MLRKFKLMIRTASSSASSASASSSQSASRSASMSMSESQSASASVSSGVSLPHLSHFRLSFRTLAFDPPTFLSVFTSLHPPRYKAREAILIDRHLFLHLLEMELDNLFLVDSWFSSLVLLDSLPRLDRREECI